MKSGTVRCDAELIVDLLRLLATDLGRAIRESDDDCTAVCQSLADIASANYELSRSTATSDFAIDNSSKRIDAAVSASIVGLQYHDRLTQRITVIRTTLERLPFSEVTVKMRCGNFSQHLLESEIAYRTEQHRLGFGDLKEPVGHEKDAAAEPVEIF